MLQRRGINAPMSGVHQTHVHRKSVARSEARKKKKKRDHTPVAASNIQHPVPKEGGASIKAERMGCFLQAERSSGSFLWERCHTAGKRNGSDTRVVCFIASKNA